MKTQNNIDLLFFSKQLHGYLVLNTFRAENIPPSISRETKLAAK